MTHFSKRVFSLGLTIALFANLSVPSFASAGACEDLKADAQELKVQRKKMDEATQSVEEALEEFSSAKSRRKVSQWIGIPVSIAAAGFGGMGFLAGAMSPTGIMPDDSKSAMKAAAVAITISAGVMYFTYKQAQKYEGLLKEAKANAKELSNAYADQRAFLIANWATNKCQGSPF